MIEIEDIHALIVATVAFFIALVFWVSYRRVGSAKLLITAIAFSLFTLKALGHFLGLDPSHGRGPYMLLIDILIIVLIALPILKHTRSEEDEEDDGGRGPGEDDAGEEGSGADKAPRPEEGGPAARD